MEDEESTELDSKQVEESNDETVTEIPHALKQSPSQSTSKDPMTSQSTDTIPHS